MAAAYEVNGDAPMEEPISSMIDEPRKSNIGEVSSANYDRDSSESTPSDHGSIYLAARASSGVDGSRQYLVDNQLDDMLDTDLASMVMFVSLKPAPATSHLSRPDRNIDDSIHKGSRSPWRRLQSRSETYRQPRKSASLTNHSTSEIDRIQTLTRKTLSLDDAGRNERAPTWTRSLISPVSPLRPKYPPPTRSPTPPGLPSFGSRQAADYARGFLGHSPTSPPNERPPREYPDQLPRQDSDDSRRGSYGERIQNFFRQIFAANAQVNNQSRGPTVSPIGRAVDGTAVQGRFPYRHSGHGTNLCRRLEDHPFHRVTGDTSNRSPTHRQLNGKQADAKIGLVSSSRPSRIESRANRLQSPTSPVAAALPSIPEPAVTARSTPRSASFARPLPRHVSLQSPPPQRHERRSFPAECAGRGFLDGSGADDSPTSTQPPAVSPMQAAAPGHEPSENQAHPSIWTTTSDRIRGFICCPILDRDENDTSIPLSTSPGNNTEDLQDSRSNFVTPPLNSNRQTQRRCFPSQVFYAPAYTSDLIIEPVAA